MKRKQKPGNDPGSTINQQRNDMTLAALLGQLIDEYGTDKERTKRPAIVKALTKVIGNQQVPDHIANKVEAAGAALRALGVR